MAITLPRIFGRNVTITMTNGSKSNWETIGISTPDDDFEATSASSLYKQFFDGQLPQAVLTVAGFLGADDDDGTFTMPANRDVVSAISIGVGSDSILPEDFTAEARGIWKVKNPKIDLKKDAATYSFDIKSGYGA